LRNHVAHKKGVRVNPNNIDFNKKGAFPLLDKNIEEHTPILADQIFKDVNAYVSTVFLQYRSLGTLKQNQFIIPTSK
jgi:hypothetical protein